MLDSSPTRSENRQKRIRKKKKTHSSADGSQNKFQTMALSLIASILVVYSYGLTSSIRSLPDIKLDQGLLYSMNKKHALNIANENQFGDDENRDTDTQADDIDNGSKNIDHANVNDITN